MFGVIRMRIVITTNGLQFSALRLTRAFARAKAPPVFRRLARRRRARESVHRCQGFGGPPKEQPPPESLRHQGPRAPDSLERVPRGATEGAKLSGRSDRRG